LDFEVALPSLFTDVIDIRSIVVNEARVNYETRIVNPQVSLYAQLERTPC